MDDHNLVKKGLRTTLFGILVNLGLAIVKATAGIVGNSYALIADAIESTTDILTSFVVYIGLRVSTRPRDDNHPYGHGKAEPIASVFVTLALLGAAAAIIVESVHEIVTPHHTPAIFTLFVLAAVVLIKETLFRFVFKVGDEVHSTAVKADAWHHRSDAITSAAVFVGILIAVIGGKGWESADDWAALFASAMIVFNAVRLFIPAFNEIMDARPQGNHETKIREIAMSVPGVRDTEKCMVRKMGLEYFVDLHIQVDGDISVRNGHGISHRVKDALLGSPLQIVDATIHIEPFEKREEEH